MLKLGEVSKSTKALADFIEFLQVKNEEFGLICEKTIPGTIEFEQAYGALKLIVSISQKINEIISN